MDVMGPDSAASTAQRQGSRKDYDAFISYARKADEAFATALQRGLHHLAKPWNRRRAMEVFRDRTSLPASSGLLPSIQRALDASRWFVLLASPESARSNWVGDERRGARLTRREDQLCSSTFPATTCGTSVSSPPSTAAG